MSSRKRENLLSVSHKNYIKNSNDQRGKLDYKYCFFASNCAARETQDYVLFTALSYKQPNKLSQLQNTQWNLLTVTFLAV